MPADVNAWRLWVYGGDLRECYLSKFSIFLITSLAPSYRRQVSCWQCWSFRWWSQLQGERAEWGRSCKWRAQGRKMLQTQRDRNQEKQASAMVSSCSGWTGKQAKKRTYQRIHLMMKLARTAAKQLPIARPVQMKLIWWFGTPTWSRKECCQR